MRWTARRRLIAAGAGALAVHALLALFIATRPRMLIGRADERRAPPAIAVTLEERSRRELPHEPEPGRERRREGPARAEGPSPAQPPRGVQPGGVPAPWSEAWRAQEGVAPGAGGPLVLGLPNGGSSGAGAGEPAGPVREKTAEEKWAEEKQTVRRNIESWAGDTAARERAKTAPDRYWRGVGDALAHGFEPGWDVLDKGPGHDSGGVRSQFWDSWKRSAEAYGKTGSPNGSEERRSLNEEVLTLRNEDRGLGSVSLGSAPTGFINFDLAVRGLAGKSWTHALVATVKITQREDGSIFSVELLGTSGNAAYDKLALQQARRLDTLHLGAPRQGRATLWAFESTFTQVPPAPIAGCALDDFVPKHCWYPLQKFARSRVTLLAIY